MYNISNKHGTINNLHKTEICLICRSFIFINKIETINVYPVKFKSILFPHMWGNKLLSTTYDLYKIKK
jgi:hypothetical protein